MLEFLNEYLDKDRKALMQKRLAAELNNSIKYGPVIDQNEAEIPAVPGNVSDMGEFVTPVKEGGGVASVVNTPPQNVIPYNAQELATPTNEQMPIAPSNLEKLRSIASIGFEKSPEDQALEASLRQKMQDQIKNYEQGIKKQKDLLAARQQAFAPQINLRPGLAYTDALLGTNTAAAYQAPKMQDEFLAEQSQLQTQVTSQEGGLLDKVRAALVTPDNDLKNFLKIKQIEAASFKNQEGLANRKLRIEAPFTKELMTKVALPMAEYGLQKNVLVKNIQEGTPDALQSVGAFMARLYLEKGPLSDSDVGRTSYTTYKTDLDNFLAKVQNNPNDVQLPQLQASLQKRAALLLEETDKAFEAKLNYFDELTNYGSYQQIKGPGEVGELVKKQRESLDKLKQVGFPKNSSTSDIKSIYEQEKKAGIYAPKR